MRLDKIILDNFLTYEHLEYDFTRSPLLVQGRNLTEEDQESNGSGKSGIFSGIEFCIAGSNSRDVRDQELVMFGQTEANTELYASCDVRKESIHIKWTIKVKGSNKLQIAIQKSGEEYKEVSFSNVNDGKKFVLNWFDIEKEDLFNYYIINKSRFKTFFKASNKEKVELINRFSDASIIDGLDKLDNTILQNEYNTIKSNIDKLDGKVELITDQILQEKNKDVEAEDQSEKTRIQDEIEDAEDIKLDVLEEICDFEEKRSEDLKTLKETNGKLKALEQKVNSAQKVVDAFVVADVSESIETQLTLKSEQEDLIDIQESEMTVLSSKSLKLGKLVKDLQIELSGSIECPACQHEFVLDCKHGTLDEVKAKLDKAELIEVSIQDKYNAHKETIEAIEVIIDTIDNKLTEISEASDLEQNKLHELKVSLNKIVGESQTLEKTAIRFEALLVEHDKDIADCENDIKKLELSIKGLKQDLKNVGANTSEMNTDALEASLDALRLDKLSLDKDLSNKGDEIYKNNQWANNFKQFRMHLANQSLEAIEFHMNRYLDGMESDLKVKLEGFKMLANGTFKEEITAKIVRDVERTFSSFSGGEQGRLLFAAILANRHMINSTHKYGGLDFLSIDEVFEGVDSLGLKKLVKSAKQLDIAVMIITHVTDEEVNDDILLIEKINGKSKIKTN